MTKKELQEKINDYKPNYDYLYQRHDGEIRKYLLTNNSSSVYVDIKTGITVDTSESLLLGKVSENIIDLIEVGDYVNGERVIETQKEVGYVFVDKETEFGTKTFTDYQINSIVTKEQFKKCEYRLEK